MKKGVIKTETVRDSQKSKKADKPKLSLEEKKQALLKRLANVNDKLFKENPLYPYVKKRNDMIFSLGFKRGKSCCNNHEVFYNDNVIIKANKRDMSSWLYFNEHNAVNDSNLSNLLKKTFSISLYVCDENPDSYDKLIRDLYIIIS